MRRFAAVLLAVVGLPRAASAYPTDAYERTKIRRLEWQKNIDLGLARGRKDHPGAQWTTPQITLRLTGPGKDFVLRPDTPKDAALQAGLEQVLRKNAFRDYRVALVDLTDPAAPRFAGVDETVGQTPGSVAKVLVAGGLLRELRERFPNAPEKREELLRSVMIVADDWAMPNHHEIPVTAPDFKSAAIRPVKRGDTFSLWEWLDHMLSPSSNASASLVWREATLMRLLGPEYPPAARDAALFARWDKETLSKAAFDVVEAPLREVGLDPEAFNVRMFFTKGAGKLIDSDRSNATPLAIVQWMLEVEKGRMVDAWSSLELKRQLYLTRRRIRYGKARVLENAALFFKSGSLYKCKPEEGYVCEAYKGNEVNVLNALVEIEAPPLVYIVAVMSNELKKAAADDHERLGGLIHTMLLDLHRDIIPVEGAGATGPAPSGVPPTAPTAAPGITPPTSAPPPKTSPTTPGTSP